MRTRTKLLVLATAALLGLAGAEIAARAFGLQPMPGPGDAGVIVGPSAEPRLRGELVPGSSLVTRFPDRRGRVVREVSAHVNAQGFRGREVEREKPADTFRIVCLGDSQTFGNGVGDEETWPHALETALREAHPGRAIEVMNCGVGGYETEQEVAYLELRLLDYAPDLVVLGFFLNDTALPDAPMEDLSAWYASVVRLLAPARQNWLRAVRDRLLLVDLGCDWAFRRLTMRRWIESRDLLFADDYSGWLRARAEIARARDLVEARGGRFAVLLVPLLMADGDELLSTAPYRKLAAFCRSEGIDAFDPEPLFTGLDPDRLRVHERDLHTDARGHEIVGRGLAAWLTERGLDGGARER